ncbi:MAG: hypothetical protein K0S01_3644 [Herbinix sp.]|jgi:spore cortex biosynthesis protein YabQ|nr:hypothetical protein [Herbinix sp.]
MNHAITVELQFFLRSILWGGLLLLVYDGLRIIRRLIKHDSFFVAVEDLIFWVAASLFIFIMMYKENNGIIRGFSVMGMAIGMILYHYIVSELLVNAITKFIRTLFRPFAIAFGKVKRFILYLISIAKKIVKFILRRLKKLRKSVKIVLSKRKQKMDVKHQKRMEKKALEKNEHEKKVAENKAAKNKMLENKMNKKNKNKSNKNKAITEDRVNKNRTNKNKTNENKADKNRTNENKIDENKTTQNNVAKNKAIGDKAIRNRAAENKSAVNKSVGMKSEENKSTVINVIDKKPVKNLITNDKTQEKNKKSNR